MEKPVRVIQSVEPDVFFKKYGFTQSLSMPHPIYNDTMYFDGLEAEYVGRLEREIEHLKKCYAEVLASNHRLQIQDHYRMHDEITRLKHQLKGDDK